jgi:HK97 family phage major capsid protein
MELEIKAQLESAVKAIDGFAAKMKQNGEDIEKANSLVSEVKSQLANVTTKSELDEKVASFQKQIDDLATREKNSTPKAAKSFNAELAEQMANHTDKFANMKKGQSFDFEIKAVGDMTFANNFSTADASVAFVRPGIIELPKRKLHVRELLQGGGMGAKSTFDYVKEIAGEGAPAAAAEGATKSQFDLDLEEVSVKAEWIAGFIKISRNMLDDVTGMTTFLGSRLPELLLRTEDAQILSGTGTSPQLKGIMTAGNFTAASGAATIDVEQLVQAISQLESLDREANGILLNPADYYAIMLTKASGSGEYDFPELVKIENGQLFIAGVPVYKSTAMTVDKFLVGDWRMGANLIFREPAKVQFFYEDGTNAQQNKVTVRIEERVALPVYGNDYFILGDFGNVG